MGSKAMKQIEKTTAPTQETLQCSSPELKSTTEDSGQEILREYVTGISSSPGTELIPGLNIRYKSTQDTLAEETTLADRGIGPAEGDNTQETPIKSDWSLDSELLISMANETVAEMQPHSSNVLPSTVSPPRLVLIDNIWGQAEVVVQSETAFSSLDVALRSVKDLESDVASPDEREQLRAQTSAQAQLKGCSATAIDMFAQLKQNTAALALLAKEQRKERVRNSDYMLTDSDLDLSESPQPDATAQTEEAGGIEESRRQNRKRRAGEVDRYSTRRPSAVSSYHLNPPAAPKASHDLLRVSLEAVSEIVKDARNAAHANVVCRKAPLHVQYEPLSRELLLETMSRVNGEPTPKKGALTCGGGCPMAFGTLLDLAKHLDAEHSHVRREWKCPDLSCAWTVVGFRTRSECQRHIRSLHEELEYKCSLCMRVFGRSDALRRHLVMIHATSPAED